MTDSTTVRKLPAHTINKYRLLAAARVRETGNPVSMNSLYVEAIEEYINKPENIKRVICVPR